MPPGNAQAKPDSPSGKTEESKEEAVASLPVPLPPPPETKFPFQFNQQVNVYQIPQNAWDRLSATEIMELTKVIIEHSDVVDKRHFDYAMEEAKRDNEGKSSR
jgi:hypothetical protein